MDRPLHGKVGCSTWIETFNLSRRSGTNTDSDRNVSNLLCEYDATCGRQHLRISNTGDRIPCRHKDRAGDHRSGERGETNLIDANDGTFRMSVA